MNDKGLLTDGDESQASSPLGGQAVKEKRQAEHLPRLAGHNLGKNWGQVQAGTILTDQPPVPNIPTNSSPPAAVGPFGWPPAVTAFWNAGVQLLWFGFFAQQWNGITLSYLQSRSLESSTPTAGPGNPYRQFVLAGPLAVGLPMVQLLGTRGVQPWIVKLQQKEN